MSGDETATQSLRCLRAHHEGGSQELAAEEGDGKAMLVGDGGGVGAVDDVRSEHLSVV
jgi:hypothetical protein